MVSSGPAAAAIAAYLMMLRCCSVSMSANALATSPIFEIIGSNASTASMRASASGPPTSIAIACSLFARIWNLDARDSLRFATSVSSAVFSSHAAFARPTASVISSVLPARRFITSV